jgi:HAMP domain-containing protein
MIAAALARLAALAQWLNVLRRLDALERQETETMAQIDDLKAANTRLTDVVMRLIAVVGEMQIQRDTAVGMNAEMQAKVVEMEARADLQEVIDRTHALADQVEAAFPAAPVPAEG